MGVAIRRLGRAEIERAFDALAALRIEVFRDFPYLYDGDLAYERRYLATALGGPDAVVVGAFDGDRLVGAATASPLADHFDDFAGPFAARGWSPDDFFYLSESVLKTPYRGQGIGVRFFEERERAAIEKGFAAAVFSAVVRPAGHPARPAAYVPLDAFWRRRGYRPVEGLIARFSWKDVGEEAETAKPMQFWMKRLTN